MKVLVVGNGGREHTLAWKLSQSPDVSKVFVAPGNAGTAVDAENVAIPATDLPALLKFAQKEKIDLTVAGPEAPLVAGIVDLFESAGLKIFGPSKLAAELEGSKAFSKELMRQANVPTAEYRIFKNYREALEHLDDRPDRPAVVKADGLASGKGVIVCRNHNETAEALKRMMVNREFGAAADRVVIEERLEGEEASILAIIDGGTIIPLESAQDHKRAWDNDEGPNTGGMGAYSPAPIVTGELMDRVIETILVPTVHQMKKIGRPFKGVLYAGVMLTGQGPKVLEFNVRLGDPETQPVLMRLRSDLAKVLLAGASGQLSKLPPLEWDPRPAVCVVMASDGYPGDYAKGKPIRGLVEADQQPGVKVFHAGTALVNGTPLTDGGRVLGVTAMGDNIADAKLKAYQGVKCIRWDGAWCRKDISDKAR